MSQFDLGQLSQALFEESQDALFLFDPDTDHILEVNAVAERLSGFRRERLLDMQWDYLFRFEQPGGRQRLRQAAGKSGVFHSQEGFFLRTGQDGVWVPVNLTVTRLHVKPKTLGLIAARDMSEQRQARIQLKKAETELRRVLSSVSDCLWSAEIVPGGRWQYRYFSPVVDKITGRPADYFLGDIKRWQDIVHPDDRPRWQNALRRLAGGQPALEEEYRVVRPDDTVCWVRDSLRVSRGEDGRSSRVDGVLSDITARKRTEEALVKEQSLLQALMDSVPDTIYFKDLQSRFIRINKALADRFGLADPAQAVGKTDFDFFNREHGEQAFHDEQEVIRSGLPLIAKEEREVLPDGLERWVSSTKMPLQDGAGNVIGTFGVSRDITQRKLADESLQRTAADLTRSNRELQRLATDLKIIATSERQAHQQLKQAQSQLVQSEKLAALGQMVAGVAHEINNPLAFVSNNVFVLQRDVNSLRDLLRLYQAAEALLADRHDEVLRHIREFADRIDLNYTLDNLEGLLNRTRDGLKRIQVIVSDLRNFARLDESDLHEVDLNAGIASTLNIIRGRAKKHDVDVEADLGPLPPVMCYPAKVNQVVLNLVANAIDACSKGGKVTVRSRANADGVEIHVEDTGSGIDPAIRDKIFDPFFTTKPPGQGTGLGLSISYRIVEDHGGRIDLDSAPGRGAHFTVHLPFKPQPARSQSSSY
ncbi:MAG TPA: PAS domain S-box protein [Gemmataceae bacterium]|jgi:PAS domain S-box-containing protein|nr:PAS domain S-box protein [Gemmataceae bacterium]